MARDTLKVTIVQETGEDGVLENVNIDLFEHLQGSQNQDSIFLLLTNFCCVLLYLEARIKEEQ